MILCSAISRRTRRKLAAAKFQLIPHSTYVLLDLRIRDRLSSFLKYSLCIYISIWVSGPQCPSVVRMRKQGLSPARRNASGAARTFSSPPSIDPDPSTIHERATGNAQVIGNTCIKSIERFAEDLLLFICQDIGHLQSTRRTMSRKLRCPCCVSCRLAQRCGLSIRTAIEDSPFI